MLWHRPLCRDPHDNGSVSLIKPAELAAQSVWDAMCPGVDEMHVCGGVGRAGGGRLDWARSAVFSAEHLVYALFLALLRVSCTALCFVFVRVCGSAGKMQKPTLQTEITQGCAPPLSESELHPGLQHLVGAYVHQALMQKKRGLASELAQKFSGDGRESDLTRVTIKIHYAHKWDGSTNTTRLPWLKGDKGHFDFEETYL